MKESSCTQARLCISLFALDCGWDVITCLSFPLTSLGGGLCPQSINQMLSFPKLLLVGVLSHSIREEARTQSYISSDSSTVFITGSVVYKACWDTG